MAAPAPADAAGAAAAAAAPAPAGAAPAAVGGAGAPAAGAAAPAAAPASMGPYGPGTFPESWGESYLTRRDILWHAAANAGLSAARRQPLGSHPPSSCCLFADPVPLAARLFAIAGAHLDEHGHWVDRHGRRREYCKLRLLSCGAKTVPPSSSMLASPHCLCLSLARARPCSAGSLCCNRRRQGVRCAAYVPAAVPLQAGRLLHVIAARAGWPLPTSDSGFKAASLKLRSMTRTSTVVASGVSTPVCPSLINFGRTAVTTRP